MKPLIRTLLFVLLISSCVPATGDSAQIERQDFGYFLTWSPDDRLLAVTTNTGLYVYDTSTHKQVTAFADLSGFTVAFSSKYMAAINGTSLQVWDLKDYDLLFQEKSIDPIQFQSVSISPDGTRLVTGEQKQFRVWELPTGNILATIPADGLISNLAFTDNNTLIAIEQYEAVIREWDLQTQNMIRSFEVPRDVLFFTLSEDGKVMLVDYGEAGLEFWNIETGKPEHYYRQMQGASGWTRLSGNHQVAIVWGYAIDGYHSGMGVWNLAEDKRVYEISTPFVNGDGWRCGALNSNGTVLAASNNEGYIYFYDLQNDKKVGRDHFAVQVHNILNFQYVILPISSQGLVILFRGRLTPDL